MTNILKQIEKVENLVINVLNGGIDKPEFYYGFDRINDNKTVFYRTKLGMGIASNKDVALAFQTMVDMVPNVTIYPLNNREIEVRVY